MMKTIDTSQHVQAHPQGRFRKAMAYVKKYKYLYIMLIPCVLYFLIFNYVPMYGVVIAFKDFNFAKGIMASKWIGLSNFSYMFHLSDFYQVFQNSLILSLLRLVFGFPFPIILALCINEIRNVRFKKITQTLIYLPHFISWVIVGGIIVQLLSPTWGPVNLVLQSMGKKPVFFMAQPQYFRPIVVLSSIWKESGWGTILYLAAISGINPELYEAAIMDGAGRLKRMWHVTLPCIRSTVVILLILNIGRLMSNGFEQIFVMQNSMNLSVSEVFETYTYRIGLLGGRFSFSAAVGLFTSVIGLVLLLISNKISKASGEEGLW